MAPRRFWRRPRGASRVRSLMLRSTPPRIPPPRQPIDIVTLHRVLDGLRALPGVV